MERQRERLKPFVYRDEEATSVALVLEAINAGLEKKSTRTIHRRIVPELIVRESTRNVK